jgi:hypothetical protein
MIIKLVYNFLYLLLLPINLIFQLLYFLFRVIFSFQFILSDSCNHLFGSGFGCDILNPIYIFTNAVTNLLIVTSIVFIGIKTYEAYKLYDKKDEIQ